MCCLCSNCSIIIFYFVGCLIFVSGVMYFLFLVLLNVVNFNFLFKKNVHSQTLWGKAKANGVFDLEMAPIEVKTKKGTQLVDTDEHPRPETQLEKLGKLNAVFKKDGVVTAANASGICDGAGSVILASEEAVKKHGLKPLARLVSYGVTGCDPSIMGIGPVTAIQQALARGGISLGDVDRFEINEAFAAQFLACAKELGLDMDKTNLHGGAISLGHPLGASGT